MFLLTKQRLFFYLYITTQTFLSVSPLPGLQSGNVVKLLKRTSPRYDDLNQLHSDDGSQFAKAALMAFCKEWGFQHTT